MKTAQKRRHTSQSPYAAPSANANKAGLEPRRVATRLLAAVIDRRTPLDALTDGEHGHPQFLALPPRDRALVRAILASALRHRRTIEKLIVDKLERSLPPNAQALSHILHVGAAQILFLDVPDSAAVDLAVTQAKADPRARRFSGLVNAVLRNIVRSKDGELERALAETRDAPGWFIERLEAAYGSAQTDAILEMHRREPPVDFTMKYDPPVWAQRLGGRVLPNGSVRVERLQAPVPELPGFDEGVWWVQDAAASLPARLLGNVAGLAVADLCAAPGGKTAQLALAGAKVTAVDLSASRLRRLSANLDRLGLQATIVQADLLKWQPDSLFDAALLDAPCSSTGTVRRHPDVPWTKSPDDIARLAQLQRELLGRALDLVRPGGIVVFSNCSLDPSEGEVLVERMLAERSDAALDPIRAEELPGAGHFVTDRGFLRTTPAEQSGTEHLGEVDGFFAARLQRKV
ncbi:RsmB/NOP family class I SAM-dependent RNA methyltransferase [Chelativorans sp. Marseille-P2723]|uniref:RsmB/NOP family class I SAM-dependent RNA methyltransferase n=1 Tax=Chelativorans sp. Marseille-P2723 TaxID=2709133 RepID=UPI001570D8DD|nr:RsmB/NOP family class I SAM-dependent RNA methyltransferase [Chelativorans sp. Marseille-P2723]